MCVTYCAPLKTGEDSSGSGGPAAYEEGGCEGFSAGEFAGAAVVYWVGCQQPGQQPGRRPLDPPCAL